MIKAGYFQFRPQFGRVGKNLSTVIQNLKQVTADLVVLPELAFTGYYFASREEAKSLAEDPHHSSTVESLIALCRERDFYLVTGFAEKAADRCFNSALLLGPKGIQHIYRKIHLFNEEKFWFDPGDTPLTVQSVRGARVGMMICFDWIFPEVVRILSLRGADIICHPSNLVLSYCQNAMQTRCLENAVFAITTNRYGADRRPHGTLRFTGKSQIVAPGGKRIQRAPAQRQELFVTELDLSQARQKHITKNNHRFKDRRPEFYAPLCSEDEWEAKQ